MVSLALIYYKYGDLLRLSNKEDISTGRFELAIVLPKLNENALKLIKLIFYIAIIVSFFYFIVIFISKEILKVNDSIGFLNYLTAYLKAMCKVMNLFFENKI